LYSDEPSKNRHQFLDLIIKFAIASSPHTTPEKKFPSSEQRFQALHEQTKFQLPGLAEWLATPVAGLDSDEDEDEEFDIVETPVKGRITVSESPTP
jgi:hypothetical protein